MCGLYMVFLCTYIDAFLNGTVITNIVPFIMSLSDL